jgi:transcriptional regulator with XRE-family HTH domain
MLGEELRAARLHAGLTQEDLAFQAGVDRSYISQLENNLKSPTVDMLLRLCRAMNASASQIISRVEQQTPAPE